MQHSTNITPTKIHKDSSLGTIPDGWKYKTLDEIGIFFKGKGVSKNEILESKITGFPCVRYAEIYTKYHYYTEVFTSKIDEQSANYSNEIKYGDILFAGSGETLEDIGKAIAYLGNEKAYAGGDIIIFRQENEDSKYLGFLLNNDFVRAQLHKLGQGHSVVHIYGKSLKKVNIPIPPLLEQQKIAQILAVWDVAIIKQEALVKIKRQLKKALMQQLLTGKIRFVGFDKEWEEVKLKEISSLITKGTTPSSVGFKFMKSGINFIKAENISKDGYVDIDSTPKISNECNTSLQRSILKVNDILFSIAGTLGRTAIIRTKDLPANTNQALSIVRIKEGDLSYVYYQLNTEIIDDYILKMVSVGAQPNLNLQQVGNIQLPFPQIREQQKIAEVLTIADNEINILQQQLQKLKTQKQGLMQQLLTGKIRVNKN